MADHTLKPEVFELNNGTMQVKITNYGAIITSLSVPDKHGMWCESFSFFSPFGYFTLNLITLSFNLLMIWLDLLIDFTRKLGWRCSWIRLCRTIRGESYLIFGLTMVLGLLIGFFAVNNVTHFVIGLSLALYQYLVLVCMLNMPFCASC